MLLTVRIPLFIALIVQVSLNATPGTRYFETIDELRGPQGEFEGFVHQSMRGTERLNRALNRNGLLSEDQINYPVPASGCAPTALLNILIWYEKYGLIASTNRDSNTRNYKLKLFNEIDHKLTEVSGALRTAESGALGGHVAMVMDQLVQERSKGQLRMHSVSLSTPLSTRDFLDLMPNFRTGYLVVLPKDKETGKLLHPHAMTFIRADRSGVMTFGTWGEMYRGRLQMRGEEQWFISQDPSHLELQVKSLMTFIPFEPIGAPASH